MGKILLLALLLFSLVGQASAMKISDYRAKKDRPQQKVQIELYLQGYIHGIFNANDILEARGDQPLFCMPDQDRFLRKGNYTDFLDSILSRTATYVKDDTTIEIAILSTFVNTYPCKGSTSVKSKK
jgi:hypothetical protein